MAATGELEGRGFVSRQVRAGWATVYTVVPEMVLVPKEIPVSETDMTGVGNGTGVGSETGYEHTINRPRTVKSVDAGMVDAIYGLYPTKDANNRGRSTGKTAGAKEQIGRVLARNNYPLEKAVRLYVAHCARSGEYLRNFKTFLNNLPDEETVGDWEREEKPAKGRDVREAAWFKQVQGKAVGG